MPRTKEVIVLYTDDGIGNSIGEIVGEVVRCKDCKYWGGRKYSNSHETDFVCEYWESDGLMWNDYCSFGERREDGETN